MAKISKVTPFVFCVYIFREVSDSDEILGFVITWNSI